MAKPYNEIYPDGDAGSVDNEGNSVAIWTPQSSVVISDTVETNNSTYSIKQTSASSFNQIWYEFDAVAGVNYTVSMDIKKGATGTEQQTYAWTNVNTSPDQVFTNTLWERFSWDVVASSTAPIRIKFNATRSTALSGAELWQDNVSILDLSIDPPVPTTTTVEIEWIDSLSAAATGNKIYRDDVEIANIANGVQIYQDATAETGTEYKYEVQAYSATDETTQEVLGVNVQYITTA